MSYVEPSAPLAGSMEKPYIFVSYARKDGHLVYPEVERLERAGYRLWCDRRHIRTGREWLDEINKAIDNCDCCLVFMSEGAASSEFVADEIDRALEYPKFIIVIYLEKLRLPADLDSRIGQIQGLEIYLLRKSEYEENLYVALFECVGPPHPPLKPPPEMIDDLEHFVIPPAQPGEVLPKVVFFSLLATSGFFGLFAVIAFATPFLIVDPRDPLSNRLGGLLVGFLFSVIASGLAVAAFAVHWLYLRRNHG